MITRKWRGGDLVLVRFADGTWEKGRVLRAPCEWREGTLVTVDCEDGFRRYVEPARIRPRLMLIQGGAVELAARNGR
jgi:translation initiation factor IF-1